MQLLYTAQNEMDAHFLKGLLAEEGIEAIVQGEALEQVWGNLPLTQTARPTVWVNDPDAARAKPIVEEYDRRHVQNADAANGKSEASTALATWVCPRCGEKIEGQFTQCWHCGTSRPETV